jgi:predicted RNA-binding Zn-ribbon protein involved in translation (DUF1610 family)
MRLLQVDEHGELSLTNALSGDDIPSYGILSHTWGSNDDEVNFKELTKGPRRRKIGYKKLRFCVEQAARDGLRYVWVDSCCIDRSNSVELGEAINSMFRWYRNAVKCYVYLADVSIAHPAWEQTLSKSRWFTRGWTLQELLAPSHVEFFSLEGSWIGNKSSMGYKLQGITGIPIDALRGTKSLSEYSVVERMSWASSRQTTRAEDKAYCLLGIFGIHMPLIYGEGAQEALYRLQSKIARRSKRRQLENISSEGYLCKDEPVEVDSVTSNEMVQVQYQLNTAERSGSTSRHANPNLIICQGFRDMQQITVSANSCVMERQVSEMQRVGTKSLTTSPDHQPHCMDSTSNEVTQNGSPQILASGRVLQFEVALGEFSEDEFRTLLAFLTVLARSFRLLLLAYVAIAGCSSIFPSVSNLLVDNILLYDALGRQHNLRFNDYEHWEVLVAMLQKRFTNCPGFEKVASGQYVITVIDEPERDVGKGNWRTVVSKRKRFKMSIVMRELLMRDGMCNKCGIPVRNVSESTFACPSCGLFYRSSNHSRKHFDYEKLRLLQSPQIASISLRVPAVPVEEDPNWRHHFAALAHRSKLMSELLVTSKEERSPKSDARDKNAHAKKWPKSAIPTETLEPTPTTESSNSRSEGDGDASTKQETPDEDAELSIQDDTQASHSRLAKEEVEIHVFKGVSIRQATPLYDAALSRDCMSLKGLLVQGVRADEHTGYWGTALTAAAFSKFDEGVRDLLHAGSNAISLAGPLHGPICAAACFGTIVSYNYILTSALKHLQKRPQDAEVFQSAIDKALFFLVDASWQLERNTGDFNATERIYVLLYAGANPFQPMSDTRTAFSIAITRRKSDISVQFLAEAWSRKSFTRDEVIAMRAVIIGEDISPEALSVWTLNCCRSLEALRTKMVDRRVFETLKGKRFCSSVKSRAHFASAQSARKSTPPGTDWSPSTIQEFQGMRIPHIRIG